MTHHEEELSKLKKRLLRMGSQAETAVARAIDALIHRDVEIAEQVRDGDDAIDRLEVEIDDQAVLLLSHAPLAGDLRLILMIMRASQNIERIGDEACKIANRARELAAEPPHEIGINLELLGREVMGMLDKALKAFADNDVESAKGTIPLDRDVNDLYKQYSDILLEAASDDPSNIRRKFKYLTAIKRLERIADHAKSIAEEVVYMTEAEDIRHQHPL